MTDLSDTIIKHFSAMFPLDNKQAQIAMSTVLLNYAVVYTSRKISKESQQIVMSLCLLFIQGMTESEARFRNMVTLGTLLSADAAHLQEAKMQDAKEKVDAVKMLDFLVLCTSLQDPFRQTLEVLLKLHCSQIWFQKT